MILEVATSVGPFDLVINFQGKEMCHFSISNSRHVTNFDGRDELVDTSVLIARFPYGLVPGMHTHQFELSTQELLPGTIARTNSEKIVEIFYLVKAQALQGPVIIAEAAREICILEKKDI